MKLTLTIDGRAWIMRGIGLPGMSRREWADQFQALGGQRLTVRTGGGSTHVQFEGTSEALAFLRSSVSEVQS